MRERLSLLLPVWQRDRPEYLTVAFRSTVIDQTRPPDHVVVVRDGPVAPTLADRIAELAATSPVPVDVVELERNVGLGPALDAGLTACRHDVVARMDADDISLPHRFAVQMPIIEAGADLVGSGLLEFGEGADDVVGRRTPPTDPDDIRDPRAFRRPLQPPHGGLPAGVRAGRRRLRRLRADGGLPALGEDDRRGGPGGERRRAAGALPRRGGRLPPPRRARASCAPSSGCSGGCARWASPPHRSTCATSSCAGVTGSCPRGSGGWPIAGWWPPTGNANRRRVKTPSNPVTAAGTR